MSDESRYGLYQGLFMSLCVLVIVVAIVRSCAQTLRPAFQPVAPSPITQKPNNQKPSAIPKREVPHPSAQIPIEKSEDEPSYKLTPTKPTSDWNDEYTLLIQECHRSGEQIICSGKATNKTDARTKLAFHGGNAIDNEGNSAFLDAQFPGSGIDMYLLPDVPTNFKIEVKDKHQKATSLNLQLKIHWESDRSTYDTPVYKDLPIQ